MSCPRDYIHQKAGRGAEPHSLSPCLHQCSCHSTPAAIPVQVNAVHAAGGTSILLHLPAVHGTLVEEAHCVNRAGKTSISKAGGGTSPWEAPMVNGTGREAQKAAAPAVHSHRAQLHLQVAAVGLPHCLPGSWHMDRVRKGWKRQNHKILQWFGWKGP